MQDNYNKAPAEDKSKLPLNERHRAEFRASGITDETIEAAGVFSVTTNAEVAAILGWRPQFDLAPAWCVPFGNGYARLKPDHPRFNDRGKVVKYESPKGRPCRAYFPPNFQEMLRSGEPIVITEGEKKTLAISQLGFPCIGLVGVWNFAQKQPATFNGTKYGPPQLIPELDAIAWTGRVVVIVFDSDIAHNPSVQLAENRLAEVLEKRGVTVRIARLPQDGDEKVGADDFIVSRGGDSFRQIIAAAKRWEKPDKYSPAMLARAYLSEEWTGADGISLRWQSDQFFRWDGRVYHRLPDSELKTILSGWLNHRIKCPRERDAKEVMFALQEPCRIPNNLNLPVMEIDNGFVEGVNLISMRNGIIDLDEAVAGTDGKPVTVMTHTSKWVCEFGVPYNYNASATCPTWFTTLDEMFDGDRECVNLLAEFFGYCLTDDTTYHSILVLEGPPRTGKSTILRTMQYIIGKQNTATPMLMSLADPFGLSGLLGKRLAICADAHLGHGDKAAAVLERLKGISGEDPMEVNQKYKRPISVRLKTRFALAVNELPKFGDGANALASRVLILPMRNSFLGRENRDLEAQLQQEAEVIFLWALDGLCRLRSNKRFTVPRVSAEILRDFARLTSPIHAFLDDCCEVGDGTLMVRRDDLWTAWCKWCAENGNHAGSRDRFGSQLRSQVPRIADSNLREGAKRVRYYVGVKLK